MSVDDEFISYLNADFLGKQIEIITPDQLSTEETQLIPASWVEISSHPGRDAVEETLSLWRQAIPGRFPRLLDLIDRFGHTVHLARVTLESEPKPSVVLLYALHGPGVFTDNFEARIGFPPRTQSNLPEFWGQLPDGIRTLYHEVHDGFLTNIWAGPSGLIRSNEMFRFGDEFDQSDFLYYVYDEHGKAIRDSAGEAIDPDPLPNLDNLIEICKNPASARILVDISTDGKDAWERWDGSLEYWPNLWDRLDTWLMDVFTADGYKAPS